MLHTAENNEVEATNICGPPHEAMFFVLAYLPLLELLAMSEVCTSLRDALNCDILPWLNIVVQRPLNSRLSDDVLMKITSKANGRLTTLALTNCWRITDDGLQAVIANNPRIQKLHVPACTSLTPEGVIRAVKALTEHTQSLMSLKIYGINNLSKEHLETLGSLIQPNQTRNEQRKQQPNLYICRHGEETDGSIDVDICPKCDRIQKVFDCPRESSKLAPHKCRGCYFCIPRCEECGRCVEYEEEGEAACADVLCLECWLQLPKCNFCNKPYCNQHVNQQCRLPGSLGFLCGPCHENFTGNS